MSNFMNISPVAAELSHADGQDKRKDGRDMTKQIVAFRNFVNAPKKKTHKSTLYVQYLFQSR
jgi:hypothetical protein